MNGTLKQPLALSSFQRIYWILGTAALCVIINKLMITMLPDENHAVIMRDVAWVENMSTGMFLLWGVIIAPAWETIFQGLPAYMLGDNPSPGRALVYMCMSATPFAGIHAIGYSLLYATLLLPSAFILAYTYYHFYRRNQMPYLITAIVHGLINLFSYFVLLWS